MIKSVKKAADILTIISGFSGAASLEDISRETNLNKSTCAHILSTLCSVGFVTHPSRTEGYTLGPFVYYLTQNGRFGQDLIKICAPIMNWLHKRTGETVVLSVLYKEYKLIIHRIEGKLKLSPAQHRMIKGQVYLTATGRMLLAHMPEEELDAFILRMGMPRPEEWLEADTVDKLKGFLAEIRKNGYAYAADEPGACGFACELHNARGTVGALGLGVPRIDGEDHRAIIAELRRAAGEINRRLDFDTSVRE